MQNAAYRSACQVVRMLASRLTSLIRSYFIVHDIRVESFRPSGRLPLLNVGYLRFAGLERSFKS